MDFVVKDDGLFLGDKKIRVTTDTPKRISVYDTLMGIGGQSNATVVSAWARLQVQHPEVRNSYMFRNAIVSAPIFYPYDLSK
jgi:hypothetical protein